MLGASCRRKMLTTDASLTGWGAISEGRSSQGLWKDHHLSWRINRLDMLAVFLALKNFLTDLRGHRVLVRSDNTSVVSYINPQGGLRSRPLCKLACQILLWSQRKLLSLHSRAPSTRKLYALKWKVFASWCSDHQLDPVNCPVGTVLEFLQDRFTAGLAPSTLKVYVAAIVLTTFLWVVCLWGMTPWYLFFLRGT